MAFSRKHLIYAAAAPLTLGALLATTALPASAAVAPPRHAASGSMELGGPLQYEQFRALQGFGRNHGEVTYTNWQYAEPGSGVWAPAPNAQGTATAPQALVFTYPVGSSSQYNHTLNGGLKLAALSPDRLAFSGTGAYSGGQTWTIKGQVRGDRLHAVIAYDNSTYRVTLDGRIAANGSVSGNATAVNPAQALTFTMPAGAFASVLHYHARIQSDWIQRHDATFSFTIPRGEPAGLAGLKITVKVHDGGWGTRHDRYAHGVTGTPLSPYPIIGGPGVTIR
jgi:hypothetical protein